MDMLTITGYHIIEVQRPKIFIHMRTNVGFFVTWHTRTTTFHVASTLHSLATPLPPLPPRNLPLFRISPTYPSFFPLEKPIFIPLWIATMASQKHPVPATTTLPAPRWQ
jgi:hypothetical protein